MPQTFSKQCLQAAANCSLTFYKTRQLATSFPKVPGPDWISCLFLWKEMRFILSIKILGFPCGSAGKEPACHVGDLGLIPGLGRSPGDPWVRSLGWEDPLDKEGIGYPLQYPGSADKEFACNVGDLGSISGLGRFPGGGKGYHSSILAWRIPWTIAMGSTKSQTWLSDFHLFHLLSLIKIPVVTPPTTSNWVCYTKMADQEIEILIIQDSYLGLGIQEYFQFSVYSPNSMLHFDRKLSES